MPPSQNEPTSILLTLTREQAEELKNLVGSRPADEFRTADIYHLLRAACEAAESTEPPPRTHEDWRQHWMQAFVAMWTDAVNSERVHVRDSAQDAIDRLKAGEPAWSVASRLESFVSAIQPIPREQSTEVVPRAAAESLAQALEQFVETGSPTAMFYALAAYRAAHPKAEP